jgi:GNAT superfamily N-acetyltransferase
MFSINEVSPANAVQAAELLYQLTGAKDDIVDVAEHIRKLNNNKAYHVIGVYAGETLVGLGSAIIFHNICPGLSPTMLIETVVIDKDFRRRGAGTMIVKHFEALAEDEGCRYITLNSEQNRTDAHAMYLKLGYVKDYSFQKIFNPDIDGTMRK